AVVLALPSLPVSRTCCRTWTRLAIPLHRKRRPGPDALRIPGRRLSLAGSRAGTGDTSLPSLQWIGPGVGAGVTIACACRPRQFALLLRKSGQPVVRAHAAGSRVTRG